MSIKAGTVWGIASFTQLHSVYCTCVYISCPNPLHRSCSGIKMQSYQLNMPACISGIQSTIGSKGTPLLRNRRESTHFLGQTTPLLHTIHTYAAELKCIL